MMTWHKTAKENVKLIPEKNIDASATFVWRVGICNTCSDKC